MHNKQATDAAAGVVGVENIQYSQWCVSAVAPGPKYVRLASVTWGAVAGERKAGVCAGGPCWGWQVGGGLGLSCSTAQHCTGQRSTAAVAVLGWLLDCVPAISHQPGAATASTAMVNKGVVCCAALQSEEKRWLQQLRTPWPAPCPPSLPTMAAGPPLPTVVVLVALVQAQGVQLGRLGRLGRLGFLVPCQRGCRMG